ncbi:MBL fold metallo-hydrolase [Rhizosaccharibacter radicis]|uniref:MBL fold metallo-hydrolase n=1 Tax=Rhizosaccharibacter radicis TaxID=2782605 RepID=A0ABT1VYQ9_9PROT|nr:MBL fold metallo-hydrolase [Acetobacteraceae bacterium KSS12]
MRVTMLGSGGSAGVPMLGGRDGRGDWGQCDPREPRNRRTRSSIVIEGDDGRRLLVDTAPDLHAQLIGCGIGRIDALFYTHAHADHVAGLDEVRSLNRVLNRPIQAFGTEPVMAEIAGRFAYAFRPWSPPGFYRPVIEPVVVEAGSVIEAAGLRLELFTQRHGQGTTLGLRTGRFAYCTDVMFLDEAALEVLAGVDTWIVGCFQRAPHPAHAHLDLVLEWRRRIGARRTILTHIGVDLDWDWMQRHLPPDVEPGFDGCVINT